MSAQRSPLERFGTLLGRDTAIYTSGALVTFVVSIANVAVLTRFLEPEQFGELALLLIFAALLTVLYNLCSLQGTLLWVFGASEEGEGGGDEQDRHRGGADAKRRALGSALSLTVAVAAAGTLACAGASGALAELVTGERAHADLVVLAAISGALGAVWRFAANVPRFERKPGAYVAQSSLRPVLVLAAAVPLVASGGGVRGALLGVVIGTAVSLVLVLVLTRANYRLAFDLDDMRSIVRAGLPVTAPVIAFWVVHNADLYVVSLYEAGAEVGIYRVASRFGAFLSYFVSAYLMAWMPLTATAAFQAVARERGWARAGAPVTTYYVLASLVLVLGLAVGSDALVRIAAPAYADAAPLIPLIGAGFAVYGLFLLLYRVTRFPRRRLAYVVLSCLSGAVFLGAAFALTPPLGTYGAALAVLIAFVPACAAMFVLGERAEQRVRFEYGRMAAATLVAAALWIGARAASGAAGGAAGAALAAAALAAYPLALVALGIVPREHVRPLARVLRSALPRARRAAALRERVARLPEPEQAALQMVVRERRTLEQVARLAGVEGEAVARTVARGLRRLADGEAAGAARDAALAADGAARPADAAIGAYLASPGPAAAREDELRELLRAGADPSDVDRLERQLELLRPAARRIWGGRSAIAGPALPPAAGADPAGGGSGPPL